MAALSRLSLLLMSLLAGLSGAAPIGVRGFSFIGVRNRLITPNGDGLNDKAFFTFDNAQDAAGSLKIYDARGHQVASIDIPAGATSASWDARAGGQQVSSGIYIYVIMVEQVKVSGALAVIR
ncbi:MAG: hypothetical protein A2V88_11105 [Elusimicrobia bacterium RBG_16_66_12]|nr:MAG: hypothetical protein A2V88_11105 [Elusimicrobia bacterium RBG_16_66_12]